ncbi:hypothetical protein MKW94_006861, partial [Papaver nudicaule]|nr:hypothetical protein [Papaver nudicaule]
FAEQYESAVRNKAEKEHKEDARSSFKMAPTKTLYEMEKQVQGIFTIAKFLEFQKELSDKKYCAVMSVQDETPVITYHIQEEIWIPKPKDEETSTLESTNVDGAPKSSPPEGEKEYMMIRVMFKVAFEKEKCEFECSCHNFEFRGIVCRHAIIVLHRNDIFLLPEKYLFRRWRKDVERMHTNIQVMSDAWLLTPKQLRYNELCKIFAELANAASSSDVQCDDAKKWAQERLKVINSNASAQSSPIEVETIRSSPIEIETIHCPPIVTKKVGNPPAANKKGRPRNNTPKAEEYITKRSKKGKENAEVTSKLFLNYCVRIPELDLMF